MPIEHSQLVSENSQFYRKNFRRLLKFALVLASISLLLLGLIFYQQIQKASTQYFVTTSDGRLIEIKPFQ